MRPSLRVVPVEAKKVPVAMALLQLLLPAVMALPRLQPQVGTVLQHRLRAVMVLHHQRLLQVGTVLRLRLKQAAMVLRHHHLRQVGTVLLLRLKRAGMALRRHHLPGAMAPRHLKQAVMARLQDGKSRFDYGAINNMIWILVNR
jgi:hypothetical protein